jgi:hypothetical protein
MTESWLETGLLFSTLFPLCIKTNYVIRKKPNKYFSDDDCGHDLDINGSNEIYMDKYIMYYVNDGIYGSFRDALITPDYVSPSILQVVCIF